LHSRTVEDQLDSVRKYEAAGAFGAEIKVVPVEAAAEISRRT